MSYSDFINRFSATPLGSWIARVFAARLDPWLYRVTKGRLTTTVVATIPQLALTTVGRRSGKARSVQLGYLADGDDCIIFASNFGREMHPAWSYNLEANPQAEIQLRDRVISVIAARVSNDDKERLWPRLVAAIPQLAAYRTRTNRDIRVFRLKPRH